MKGSIPVHKLYENCSELCRRGEADLVSGQTLFLTLIFLNPNKNVIKNNITSSVIHIIVCLPKTE